jgi:hypothetical protein
MVLADLKACSYVAGMWKAKAIRYIAWVLREQKGGAGAPPFG